MVNGITFDTIQFRKFLNPSRHPGAVKKKVARRFRRREVVVLERKILYQFVHGARPVTSTAIMIRRLEAPISSPFLQPPRRRWRWKHCQPASQRAGERGEEFSSPLHTWVALRQSDRGKMATLCVWAVVGNWWWFDGTVCVLLIDSWGS